MAFSLPIFGEVDDINLPFHSLYSEIAPIDPSLFTPYIRRFPERTIAFSLPIFGDLFYGLRPFHSLYSECTGEVIAFSLPIFGVDRQFLCLFTPYIRRHTSRCMPFHSLYSEMLVAVDCLFTPYIRSCGF